MARQPVRISPSGDHARHIENVLDRKSDAGERPVRRAFDLDLPVAHEGVELVLHLPCPSCLRACHSADQAPFCSGQLTPYARRERYRRSGGQQTQIIDATLAPDTVT